MQKITETRRIDDIGRIAIPKSIRTKQGIRPGDSLAVSLDEHGVITIAKHQPIEELNGEMLDRLLGVVTTPKGLQVALVSTDTIVTVNGPSNIPSILKGQKISIMLAEKINTLLIRKPVSVVSRNFPLLNEENNSLKVHTIYPIDSNAGALVIYGDDIQDKTIPEKLDNVLNYLVPLIANLIGE